MSDGISTPMIDPAILFRAQMPEERLLHAVLEEALHVMKYPCDTPARREAAAWFADTTDWGVFSFEGMCAHFGFSASALRAKVLAPGFRLAATLRGLHYVSNMQAGPTVGVRNLGQGRKR